MFHDLSMIFLNRIGDKGVELLYDIDIDLPMKLKGDSQRIRQIIINLMNNAIKFTEEGYVKLSVECRKTSDEMAELTFRIEDTGQGIRKEDISKLFGSFQQVDTKKNRYKEGTGLGLAISKQLVELMSGTIGVESEYGKGSVFYGSSVTFRTILIIQDCTLTLLPTISYCNDHTLCVLSSLFYCLFLPRIRYLNHLLQHFL